MQHNHPLPLSPALPVPTQRPPAKFCVVQGALCVLPLPTVRHHPAHPTHLFFHHRIHLSILGPPSRLFVTRSPSSHRSTTSILQLFFLFVVLVILGFGHCPLPPPIPPFPPSVAPFPATHHGCLIAKANCPSAAIAIHSSRLTPLFSMKVPPKSDVQPVSRHGTSAATPSPSPPVVSPTSQLIPSPAAEHPTPDCQ